MIRVDMTLRRCWILGHRCHHWMLGVGLIALGAAFTWDDRRDIPWPGRA